MTGESGPPGADPTLCRRVAIVGDLGLHARPAARFVKLAQGFDAEIEVACKGGAVSGRSIMGLMMLAASAGTELTIRARGPDAATALTVLGDFVANGFTDAPPTSIEDRPVEDGPVEDRPVEDRPVEDGPTGDMPDGGAAD